MNHIESKIVRTFVEDVIILEAESKDLFGVGWTSGFRQVFSLYLYKECSV